MRLVDVQDRKDFATHSCHDKVFALCNPQAARAKDLSFLRELKKVTRAPRAPFNVSCRPAYNPAPLPAHSPALLLEHICTRKLRSLAGRKSEALESSAQTLLQLPCQHVSVHAGAGQYMPGLPCVRVN